MVFAWKVLGPGQAPLRTALGVTLFLSGSPAFPALLP